MLRLGYGMYFGRTPNATLETALTQTGSLKGDLRFFMRPTDNLNAGGAPPFPYVLAGEPASVVKPGAVEFAPPSATPRSTRPSRPWKKTLPGHVLLAASAVVSLGRRLPVTFDANIDPAVNPQTITYAVVDGNGLGPDQDPADHRAVLCLLALQHLVHRLLRPPQSQLPAGHADRQPRQLHL